MIPIRVQHLFPFMLTLFSVLTTVPLSLAIETAVTNNYKLDQDSADEDCSVLVQSDGCIRDDTNYFKCPISCSRYYQTKTDQPAMTNIHMKDSSEFYELSTTNARGKRMSLERFEGYVTVLAVVPLLKGMGQYVVNMLERIYSQYPYTVEVAVIPVFPQDYPKHKMVQLQFPPKSKITVWQTIDDPHFHSVLKFLEVKLSTHRMPYSIDFFTCYIICGGTIDKRISPTIGVLEKAVRHYVQKLENEEL